MQNSIHRNLSHTIVNRVFHLPLQESDYRHEVWVNSSYGQIIKHGSLTGV